MKIPWLTNWLSRKKAKPVYWHDDKRASELAWSLAEFNAVA